LLWITTTIPYCESPVEVFSICFRPSFLSMTQANVRHGTVRQKRK
jgi:hypothetical protein